MKSSCFKNDDLDPRLVERGKAIVLEILHYQWMNVGWQGSDRIYRCMMHFDIKDSKIWIQLNLTDRDPEKELVEMGVSRGNIILGWQSPYTCFSLDDGVA